MKNTLGDIPYPTLIKSVSDSKHVRIMNTLSKVASDIVLPVKRNSRVSACVVYKNDIIAFGVNERKSHPFQARYSKNQDAIFLHAETAAIRNALKYISVEELEKSTLYVCRIKYEDTTKRKLVFGISKPCSGCERCLSVFGIKNVVYSLDGDAYAVL